MNSNDNLSAMSPSLRPYFERQRIIHAKRLLAACLNSRRQSRKKISYILLLFIYCEIHPKRLINTGAFGTLRKYMKIFKKEADSRAKYVYKCWKPTCKEYMKANNVDYFGKPINSQNNSEV